MSRAPTDARGASARAGAAKRTTKSGASGTGRSKAKQPARARQPVAKRPTAARPTTKRPTTKRPAAKRATATTKAPTRRAPARSSRAGGSPRTKGRSAPVRRLKAAPAQPKKQVLTAVSPRKRLITLLVLMVLALGAIVVRLVDVQAVEGDHYEAMAERQRVRSVSLAAERGSIFDRDGNDLALSVPQRTIYADPRLVKDPSGYARKLAPVVDVDRSDLENRLGQPDTEFVYVARQVSDRIARRVERLGLRGVGSVPESKRFYPGEALAGTVLGFTGLDNDGLGGLERKYEDVLRGRPGKIVAEEDPNGREIPATQRVDEPARRGGDLVLTLDQSLQYEVEQQLTAQVDRTDARGGIAIVADVTTGDVLAMASVDGANRSRPARPTPASEANRALTAVYEPGSTAKVITVGAALETGKVQPTTAFTVPWRMQIEDRLFEDADEHNDAHWTVHDIVRESSNVGVIKIASLLGKEKLDEYQRRFGFGKKTAIGFPHESAGLMKDVWEYVPSDMGSVPIGYTTAVTPMQMLDVFTTVANGGVSRPPRLVAATIGPDGTRREIPAKRGKRVISSTTAAQLNEMLRSVVSDGTGEQAAISGYTVAGKTGTSRKPPYEPTPRYMASFAGFAPAESPRLAAIVVIDQPGTRNEEYFGGKVAAPLFSTIMQYALRVEKVPPTSAVSSDPLSPAAVVETSTAGRVIGRRPAATSTAPVAGVPPGIVAQPTP